MSGYGSAHRSYQGQELIFSPGEHPLPRSLVATLTHNGLAPQTDPWSKTSYASDHICKPVIVDAEGRKHPIVYNPGYTTEACITTTETVVQQQAHHGYVEHKWYQSSSPVHDRPHKVEEFTKGQTEGSQPKKFSLLSPSSWRQSPNSTGYHGSGNTGYGDYNSKSSKDWPKPNANTIRNGNPNSTGYHGYGNSDYGDYNDKSSKDWSKPSGNTVWNGNTNSASYHEPGNTGYGDYNDKSSKDWPKASGNIVRSGNPNSTGYHGYGNTGYEDYNDKSSKDWPKPSGNPIRSGNPNSTGYHGSGNTGYEDYNDKSSKDWPKPSGNTIRNGNYDGNYNNQINDSKMEPTMVASSGWARPSRAGWAAPPDTSLSRPTNDIGKAMEFLKGASKTTSATTSPHSRYTVPVTTGHKKDGYGETIDSSEASKRYGHFPPSLQSEEKHTATIDSKEAARKYKGAAVPM